MLELLEGVLHDSTCWTSRFDVLRSMLQCVAMFWVPRSHVDWMCAGEVVGCGCVWAPPLDARYHPSSAASKEDAVGSEDRRSLHQATESADVVTGLVKVVLDR